MIKASVLEARFREIGAIHEGHFVPDGWDHSDVFVDADLIGQDEHTADYLADRVCRWPCAGAIILGDGAETWKPRIAKASKLDETAICALPWSLREEYGKLPLEFSRQHRQGDGAIIIVTSFTAWSAVNNFIFNNKKQRMKFVGCSAILNPGGLGARDAGFAPFFAAWSSDHLLYPASTCPWCHDPKRVRPVNREPGYGYLIAPPP